MWTRERSAARAVIVRLKYFMANPIDLSDCLIKVKDLMRKRSGGFEEPPPLYSTP